MLQNFFSNFHDCFNSEAGCGWKEIGFIFDDILKALFVIGLFVAAVMVSYAGWLLLKGQGDSGSRTKAKNIFKDIIIGMILLFGAYYIVDLVLTKVGFDNESRAGFVEPSQK